MSVQPDGRVPPHDESLVNDDPLDLNEPPCSFIRSSRGSRPGSHGATASDNQAASGLEAFSEELTPAQGDVIGSELDSHDAPVTAQLCISLIFLLVNSAPQAFALCKALEAGRERPLRRPYGRSLIKVFLDTAKSTGLKRWDLGLACALHLLRKYRLLAKVFRLSHREAREKFEDREHLFLEKYRVGLFKLSNNLTKSDSEAFLGKMLRERRPERPEPEFSVTETNLLQLLTERRLGMEKPIRKYLRELDSTSRLASMVDEPIDPIARNITSLKRGRCIILNQDEYLRCSDYESRGGTEHDQRELQRVWGEKLGCDVTVYKDKTGAEIRDLFNTLSQSDFSSFDFLVVVILGHGCTENNADYLVGVDGVKVRLEEEIYRAFQDGRRCPSLLGKLKLFVTQACRGKDPIPKIRTDSGCVQTTPTTTTSGMTAIGDFLVFNSTLQGFASFRRETEGTFFIQLLCRELDQNHASETVFDLLNSTAGHVKKLTGVMFPEIKVACPLVTKAMFAGKEEENRLVEPL